MGSFLNVLSSRYSEKTGFKKAFQGRSYCDHCKKTLRWFELIPILSYLFQRGKCMSCKGAIPWQYAFVELLAGLIAIAVPLKIGFTFFAFIWVFVLWTLLLMSIVDFRLKIIPNSLVVAILFLGVVSLVYQYIYPPTSIVAITEGLNLLGHYSLVLTASFNFFVNHVVAVGAGILLFGGIYLLTRGRAMGFGDVKLVGALGFLIAWPDILVVLVTPFLVGSLVGLPLILSKKLKLKSSIPFGPFIAIGVLLTFFFGYDIVNAYFGIFNLI